MKDYLITEEQMVDNWGKKTLSNDFMFFKVMQDEELLLELLKRVLPELDIDFIAVQAEKKIEIGDDIRGVRLDIFVRDNDGRAITVEMQVTNYGYLPRRLRYYTSTTDMKFLDRDMPYDMLPDSYVVLICPFDFYGKGMHRYTFRNCCKECDGLEMDDGVTYVVLNSKGTADDVDEKLKAFLNYLNGVVSDDEYIRKLDAAVMRGRLNKEWRLEYMTIEQRDMEHERVGRERGREEGLETGIKTVVDLCKSLGGSSVDAVEKIVATMGFSQAEADRLVSKYW